VELQTGRVGSVGGKEDEDGGRVDDHYRHQEDEGG
jgi:hypothetical protein